MLLDEHAAPVADTGLARLTAAQLGTAAGERLAVALEPGGELEPIAPFLDRIDLVVLPFPGFRDGRGFTLARSLRERYGFAGEIRATGHILPDQFVALLRVGVTTVELPDGTDPAPWREALRLHDLGGGINRAVPWIRRDTLPFQVT